MHYRQMLAAIAGALAMPMAASAATIYTSPRNL